MNKFFIVTLLLALMVVIGFSMMSCKEPDEPAHEHIHTYGAWQSNAVQHWKECSCGEEYGRADHTDDPCPVCGYSSNGDEDEDDDLVRIVIFDMQNSAAGMVTHKIQELTVGKLTIGDDVPDGEDSPINPLKEAGEGDDYVKIEAVKGPDGQKIALQFESVIDWGAGIDLPHREFGFWFGDIITITGEVLDIGPAGGYVQPNFRIDDEYAHGFGAKENGPFEWKIKIDTAMLADIRTGNPAGIRIEGRQGGQKVRIDQIRIEGVEPTGIKQLPAPVLKVSGNTISWTAIERASAYKVFVDGAKEEIATVTGTSFSLLDKEVASLAYDKEYSVTVVALGMGIRGTSDSVPSVAVKATKTKFAYGPQEGGTYVVNASDFKVWYDATVTGDEIAFTGGGAYYDYPSDFNIKKYNSLVIEYTVTITEQNTHPTGRDGGAAVTIKVYNAKLGDNSYYGDDVKYTTLNATTKSVLTINDQNNVGGNFADRWHAAGGSKGFAIAVNSSDTNDKFKIQFHSITFKP